MFGQTSPFGQSSSSPFTSQFGQSSTGNSNPFASNPFGSTTTPFGSQTGGSMFGGTSTGVFGTAQSSSPLGSTAFGTTAFGGSSSSFGGSSVFGQTPAFGGFGSTTQPQTNPFGSTSQPSQPAFGSSLFGSTTTPFGGSNQPAFGATTPTFGSTATSAFGATATPSAFGATNTTPTFGSTPSATFGSTGSAFGMSGAQAFGAPTPTPTPTFGASTSTPTFGASTAPSFNFGSSPSFGQTSSAFGSSTFGTTTSPFGAQSSAFGAQTTTPSFGNASFGQATLASQRGGSRVTAYTPTTEVDGTSSTQTAGKLGSISAMPVYKEKSHEELRCEDYQLGDKGGPNPVGQTTTSGIGFNTPATQPSAFQSSSIFGQSSSNPFSTTTPSNPFGASTSAFGTSSTSTFNPSPFAAQSAANPFGSTSNSSATPSLFGSTTTTSGFGSNPSPSIFGTTNSSAFGSSPSLFGSSSSQGTTPTFNSGLNLGGTQSSPLFQSTTPSFGQTTSAFGQNTSSAFGQNTSSAFGQNTSSAFGQSTTSPFGQSNIFSSPSTGFGGNLFSSTPSLLSSSNPGGFSQTTASLSTPFQSAQPAQTSSGFGFGNFGQTQAAATSGFGGSSGIFGQSPFGQSSISQSTAQAIQPAPITNPYGTLPVMPQMTIGRVGNSPTVQYGISSMPVVEKPAPVRISSLLTARHFSQRRIRLPARKYNPKNDGPKVPFFMDDEETVSTPKADALFVPRENPRALVICPMEQWSSRANAEKTSPVQEPPKQVYANGKRSEVPSNGSNDDYKGKKPVDQNGIHKEPNNGIHIDLTKDKEDSSNGSHIDSLIPTLQRSDYYTEPSLKELAAKERSNPGSLTHVKSFVIGRREYGSIKFLDETNVQRLDLESLVQFNNREVIVYLDDTKKPPIGQGLNKPAEVTLLNIRCFDKKSGKQCTDGPRMEKYKEMLKRKAEDQGAEFVSYDPIEGEWKFKVSHFSVYKLGEDDDWEN